MRARSRLLAVLGTTVAALACVTPAASAAIVVPPGFCLGPRHISIQDHRAPEGTKDNGVPTAFLFSVTSTGCATEAAVHFTATLGGRARIGPDFDALSATVRFPQGDMSTRYVAVVVEPDHRGEPDEDFAAYLCAPTGYADIDRGVATGWILNDDPGPLFVDTGIYPNFHCSE